MKLSQFIPEIKIHSQLHFKVGDKIEYFNIIQNKKEINKIVKITNQYLYTQPLDKVLKNPYQLSKEYVIKQLQKGKCKIIK